MKEFGSLSDGRKAYLYTLVNRKTGMEAIVTDFGAALVALFVKDQNGSPTDVVLGYDTIEGYEKNPPYLGVTVGRYANRIVRGRFTLEGKEYSLECNDGANHLHGGVQGFDKRLWNAVQTAENSVRLSLFSADMDQGYPGNIVVSVKYTLTDDGALCLDYCGMSDKATLLNLTNHSYFNLAGQDTDTILDQYLRIDADSIAAVDEKGSVTGEMMDVGSTPFDFRKGKKIGADIGSGHAQLDYVGGYDHNYFLRQSGGTTAEAWCEQTGICMAMFTDSPSVQLYTGNYLGGDLQIKGGRKATHRRAFCLETQHAPDAMNKPEYGDDPVLPGGECVQYQTRYVFSVNRPSFL